MIIPDKTRPEYFQNLIGGLAMNLSGPYVARLVFQVFVVAVGTLILSGAVNTAIIGSNGVLNRVSEDGRSLWIGFGRPHPRFREPHTGFINFVVMFQLLMILISRGDVTFLRRTLVTLSGGIRGGDRPKICVVSGNSENYVQ